jgi:hypothetical protein
MNPHADEDKLDPQDPHRRELQPPIPTHPPDPLAAGEADKVVPKKPDRDPYEPPHEYSAISSGPPIDQVGGPGLGKAPGDVGKETPATTRDRDTRAVDQPDRTHKA